MKKSHCCLAALLALACGSCSHEKLYPASGTVTFQGAPATGATVVLQRRGDPIVQIIIGAVLADGSFELVSGGLGKGAPPGTYDVLIAWRTPSDRGQGCCERRADKLAGRYADPKNPRFQVTIDASVNRLPPFELE